MKCIFQESIGVPSAKDIWLEKREVNSTDVLKNVQIAFGKNRACFFTINFTTHNTSLYPFLFIDLDSKDLEKSLESTRAFLNYFIQAGLKEENIEIAFSGAKGFHILIDCRSIFNSIPTKEEFGHKVQKQFVLKIYNEINNPNIISPDLQIYSKSRKIRALYSINHKTGLYKIPLSLQEALSLNVSDIVKKAELPKIKQTGKTDESLSFFISPLNYCEKLNFLICELKKDSEKKENEDSYKGKNKEKSNPTNKDINQISTKKDISLPSSSLAALACRAFRNNASEIIENESSTKVNRHLLVSSITGTENRDSFILKILRNDKEFKKDISEAKLKNIQINSTCENLIDNGFCKTKCHRYLKKNGDESMTPTQFGENGNGIWNEITSARFISDTAFKLKNYHKTTTDLFDWANCDQFLTEPLVYSYAISDYLRKGKIPSFKSYIASVRKDKTKFRSLTYVPFEYELLLGLFAEAGLKSNKKFKDYQISSQVIFSYGYQDIDLANHSLIKSWQEEYKEYKLMLERVSKTKNWKIVYSDDIKDFYPSFKLEYIKELIRAIYKDQRIIRTLDDLYSQNSYDFENGEKYEKFFGLSQGPLLSHIIASRALLELDKIISDNFKPEELCLVRYCDDIVFFVDEDKTLDKLKNIVIPQIEKTINISFHKDEASGKTFQNSIDEYIEKRLSQDLFKYQIRFETELASIDQTKKEDLVNLIKEIFGNTLDKFLSNDQIGNLKDLERAINTLSWKVPKLYDETNENIIYALQRLCEKILFFLGEEHIGHKMRANLTSLLISILSYYSFKFDKITDLFTSLYGSEKLQTGSRFCLIVQLQSFLSFNEKNIPAKKINEIITILNENFASVEIIKNHLLPGLELKINKPPHSSFNFDLWPTSKDNIFPNLASYIKNIGNLEIENFDQIEKILSSSDSSIIFYSKFLTNLVIQKYNLLSLEQRSKLFKLSRRFLINELEEIFWKDIVLFSESNLITDTEREIFNENSNLFLKLINSSFKLESKRLFISKRIDDINIYSDDNNFFIIKKLQIVTRKGINLQKVQAIVDQLNQLNSGTIKIERDTESLQSFLIYNLPKTKGLNHWPYVESSNQIEDILESEIHFFKKSKSPLPKVILSAKNLGIFSDHGKKEIFFLRPDEIIVDTSKKEFTYHNNNKLKLVQMGCSFSPQPRIFDFVQLYSNQDLNHEFGMTGNQYLYGLSPNKKSCHYYREKEEIVQALTNLLYHKKWLEDNRKNNEEIDSIKHLSFQLFNTYYNRRLHYSDDLTKGKFSFHPLLHKVQLILEKTSIERDGKKIELIDLIKQIHKQKEIKNINFHSIDYLIGYSICLTTYIALKENKQKIGKEILFIGLIGSAWLRNSLFEIKLKFETEIFDNVLILIDNFQQENLKTFKQNYPTPFNDVLDQALFNYLEFFEKLREFLIGIPHGDIGSHRIGSESSFSPPFSNDPQIRMQEISNNLDRFKVELQLKPNGIISNLIFKFKVKFELKKTASYQLTKILSFNHRWYSDTYEFYSHNGYATKHHNEVFISIYPKFFGIEPEKSAKLLNIKEHWFYKLSAFILFTLIVTLISKFKLAEVWSFFKCFISC